MPFRISVGLPYSAYRGVAFVAVLITFSEFQYYPLGVLYLGCKTSYKYYLLGFLCGCDML